MNSLSSISPLLPKPLVAPLALIPGVVHSTVLTVALNRAFKDLLDTGELDFLADRVLSIRVHDANIGFRFRLSARSFVPCGSGHTPDLVITGTAYDFVTLVTRREDSDTLFFNRRLMLEGDTALGLQLKNLLDGMEVPDAVQPVVQGLDRLLGLYERVLRPRT